MRSAPKKQSQRRQKQLRKQRREAEAEGIDEGADYLAALGFDEHYLAQESALGSTHTEEAHGVSGRGATRIQGWKSRITFRARKSSAATATRRSRSRRRGRCLHLSKENY